MPKVGFHCCVAVVHFYKRHFGWEGDKRFCLPSLEVTTLAQPAEREEPDGLLLSVAWGQLGERNRAMERLEKAYKKRHAALNSLMLNTERASYTSIVATSTFER